VRASINDALSLGLTPRYVEVRSHGHSHVFSPLIEVVRTHQALLVKTPQNIYLWPLSDVRVFYSASDVPIPLDDIPLADARWLDGYVRPPGVAYPLKSPAGLVICADCAMLFGPPKHTSAEKDSWTNLKDPWQRSPDWTSIHGSSERQPAGWYICAGSENPANMVCAYYGTYDPAAYYSSDPYYNNFGNGNPNATPPPPPPPPCTPAGLPANLVDVYKGDQPMQAAVQAIAAKNNGVPPKLVPYWPPPAGIATAGAAAQVNLRQVYLFTNNLTNFYASQAAVIIHELYHLWYEIKGPDGRPNPMPNEPGFVANPTVQVLNGLGQGVTMTFNILRADGTFDRVQYGAYEHVLIHDDMVANYGVDAAWTSLMDAMSKASSVTKPDGSTTSNMSPSEAQSIIKNNKLDYAMAYGRPDSAKRPPGIPDYSAGCNRATTQSVFRAPAGTRSTRDFVNDVEYYNLDGYDLIWTGLMSPADPI
jgi:hypothetical protein